MDKPRLIGGIICLVLAGVLIVLNLALPPEDLRFQIGSQNMPWIPPVVLGIVGIALMAATPGSGPDPVENKPSAAVQDSGKAALNKRLETIAWGFFLIMLGGFIFVPNDQVPEGLWSIGVGLIMLGLNAARFLYKIRMSGFTTFLGILSLLGGLTELLFKTSLEGALLLLILGAYLVLKPWFEKQKLFGKAEEN